MKINLARITFLVCILLNISVQAAESDTTITIIKNVTLPVAYGSADGKLVNIQLHDGVLDVITEDPIAIENADINYDAQNGVLLGSLEIGELASFLILIDGVDPVEALLDTQQYARLVFVQGEIVKNNLPVILIPSVEEIISKTEGWLSYTPPPRIALTTDANRNNWNRFESEYVSGVFAGAVMLDRLEWLNQDSDSFTQVGDLEDYSGGTIRGLRFGGVGTINFQRPWVWTVFASTHAFGKGFDQNEDNSLSLFDARLDIPVAKVTLSIGKQKEPISMERIMSLIDHPLQERAAVLDALLPSRNIGAVVSSTILNEKISLAGGVFNNFMDSAQPHSFSDNSTQYIGRATWLPYFSRDESTLFHLGLGLRYSDSKEGFATAADPEFNAAPDFLEVMPMAANSSTTTQFEASFRSGPFWLHSEYAVTDLDAPAMGSPSLNGYHLTFSWVATGEMRAYNKRNGTFMDIPVSRSIHQNGWGTWEYSTRFSHTDLTDGLVNGGEMDIWSAGINWWLTPNSALNLNYRYIIMEKDDIKGNSQGINFRLVLLLE